MIRELKTAILRKLPGDVSHDLMDQFSGFTSLRKQNDTSTC